jgi:hypothetical protein
MKKIFTGLLIIIVLVSVGGFIFFSTGKQVAVDWDETDYVTALDKSSIEVANIEEINLVTLARGDFTTSGTNEIEASFTNSEMSALIDTANANGGPITNFKVAFNGNNEGEMSFRITDAFIDFIQEQNMIQLTNQKTAYNSFLMPLASASNSVSDTVIKIISSVASNKPVYARGTLSRANDNAVSIEITTLKVGQLTLGEDVVQKVEDQVLIFVNRLLSSSNGFMIEELRVEDGALFYKGTLPAEIKGTQLNP